MRFRRPRVVDLYVAPELAALAVLEAALDVTIVAIVAAHPDDHELEDDPPAPERVAARALLRAVRNAVSAVNRYRLEISIERARERDELMPF
jgi:hypothetical protein